MPSEAVLRLRLEGAREVAQQVEGILAQLNGAPGGGGVAGVPGAGPGVAGTGGVRPMVPPAGTPVTSVSGAAATAGTPGVLPGVPAVAAGGKGSDVVAAMAMATFGTQIAQAVGGALGQSVASGGTFRNESVVAPGMMAAGTLIGTMVGGAPGALVGGVIGSGLGSFLDPIMQSEARFGALQDRMRGVGHSPLRSIPNGALGFAEQLFRIGGAATITQEDIDGLFTRTIQGTEKAGTFGAVRGRRILGVFREGTVGKEAADAFGSNLMSSPYADEVYRGLMRSGAGVNAAIRRSLRASVFDDPMGAMVGAAGLEGDDDGIYDAAASEFRQQRYERRTMGYFGALGGLAGASESLAFARGDMAGAYRASMSATIGATIQAGILESQASRATDPLKKAELQAQAAALGAQAQTNLLEGFDKRAAFTAAGENLALSGAAVDPMKALIGGGPPGPQLAKLAEIARGRMDAALKGYFSAGTEGARRQFAGEYYAAELEAAQAEQNAIIPGMDGRMQARFMRGQADIGIATMGYGSFSDQRQAISGQLGTVGSRMAELETSKREAMAAGKFNGAAEAQFEREYSGLRLQQYQLQTLYDQGWVGRLITEAYGMDSGGSPFVSAGINRRTATLSGGVDAAAFGGTRESTQRMLGAVPRHLNRASGGLEGAEAEARGLAPARAEVTIRLEDASGKRLSDVQVQVDANNQATITAKSLGLGGFVSGKGVL